MVDANSAYTLADVAALRRSWTRYGLMMIEQPLAWDDIVDHAALQRAAPHAGLPGRVDPRRRRRAPRARPGRLPDHQHQGRARWAASRRCRPFHDLCLARGVPVWCGGMLESGIGRLANVHLQTLPGFTLPGDTSASARYFAEDLIDPPVVVSPDGTIDGARGPGHRPRDRVAARRARHDVPRGVAALSRVAGSQRSPPPPPPGSRSRSPARPRRSRSAGCGAAGPGRAPGWPTPRTRSSPARARSRRPCPRRPWSARARPRSPRPPRATAARRAISATRGVVDDRRVARAAPRPPPGTAAPRPRPRDARGCARASTGAGARRRCGCVPVSVTSSGITLKASPPWIEPIVTHGRGQRRDLARRRRSAARVTTCAAATTGSAERCGLPPWPPRPRTTMLQAVDRGHQRSRP